MFLACQLSSQKFSILDDEFPVLDDVFYGIDAQVVDKETAGRRTAVVWLWLSFFIPCSVMLIRWSAETAPSSAAS